MKNTNNTNLIDLSILSSIIFISASFVSLSLSINEKRNITNKKSFYTNNEALNISFYNRIIILISIIISLYVSYNNYKNEKDNTLGKYKSSLLLSTSILTLISSCIILYVSYLNKKGQSLSVADIENPLI